jgi:hypothetical protein
MSCSGLSCPGGGAPAGGNLTLIPGMGEKEVATMKKIKSWKTQSIKGVILIDSELLSSFSFQCRLKFGHSLQTI